MENNEIHAAIQEAWDSAGCSEIVLNREDLANLIELLIQIFEDYCFLGIKQPITLQFLAFKNVNSAFVRGIKVNRLHTLYKFSFSGVAEDCKLTNKQEIEKEILDFDEKIGDIVEAIARDCVAEE